MIWIFLLSLLYPSLYAVCNPYTPILSEYICQRRYLSALWLSLFVGLLRDVFLSSPKIGILGLASLISAHLCYWCTTKFSFDDFKGRIQISILYSSLEAFSSFLLCSALKPTFFLPWKGLFLYTVFSTIWTGGLLGGLFIYKRSARRT